MSDSEIADTGDVPGVPTNIAFTEEIANTADPRISVPERPVPGISIPKVILVLPILPAYHEVEISAPGHLIL